MGHLRIIRGDKMNKVSIGKRIYQIRKEKNLSQEELANLIGVSRQIVSKWESDQSVPLVDKLKKMSEVLGVSYEEILQKTEYQDNPKKKNMVFRYIELFLIIIIIDLSIIFAYSQIVNHQDKEYKCLGTQTYLIDKIYSSEDDNYNYITLIKRQDGIVKTIKMSKIISNYLEEGKSYEFIFKINNETSDIEEIFQNGEMINIVESKREVVDEVNMFTCR